MSDSGSHARIAAGGRRRWRLLLAGLLGFLLAPATRGQLAKPDATEARVQRVLILSSFGTDFGPMTLIAASVRSELTARHATPIDFYEIPLELSRTEEENGQEVFAAYLAALVARRPPDLVLTLGGPAARFARAHRESLFPGRPLLMAASDPRFFEASPLAEHESTVPLLNEPAEAVAAILRVLPATETLAVVIGSSPLERFWRAELARELAPYASRLRLVWLDNLPLADLRRRVAALPPRSAVYFVLLLVDGAGVTRRLDHSLAAVCEASSAPVFGIFDTQLGSGVVGGEMLPVSELAGTVAEAADRLLSGEAPAAVRYPARRADRPRFDARQLARWRIPESRLPPGSEVLFRPESPWVRYRIPILATLVVLALQSGTIAGLLLQRRHRRAAQRQVRSLSTRLVSAYEQERRRLARELHDDVSQRLARLAIDGARIARQGVSGEAEATLRGMREALAHLGRDVHALSRRLHPSILDDLGLAAAVRSEAERFAVASHASVDLQLEAAPARVVEEVGLCLFRVAQEALRNVEKHAGARRVEVSLTPRDGGVELVVRDDGRGFDPSGVLARQGLGQLSMRERMSLVGGRLQVESTPGGGTAVRAWAPTPPLSAEAG